jgi:hypothetical protein
MCPLWQDGRRWGDIAAYPEREPLLGWYDEGDPAVTDWEIAWALDHGISFFLVCWYRAKNSADEPVVRPTLGHWLHEGLPRSRYGDRFKFAIMWENANQALPCPTTEADFIGKLVPYWIEQYFRRANYLVLEGKPVFSIYNAEKFVRELGGERQAAAALEQLRAACVRAGFKGLHLLGQYCWGPPPQLEKQARQIQRLGMDASWAYHWPTFTGAFGGNLRPSGAQAVAAQEQLWQSQPAPHLLTLSMGWDEAPWRFRYSKIQWRLTPAEFRLLCERAKALLDARPSDGIADRLVLLDNWNEFGEGHYLMPARVRPRRAAACRSNSPRTRARPVRFQIPGLEKPGSPTRSTMSATPSRPASSALEAECPHPAWETLTRSATMREPSRARETLTRSATMRGGGTPPPGIDMRFFQCHE